MTRPLQTTCHPQEFEATASAGRTIGAETEARAMSQAEGARINNVPTSEPIGSDRRQIKMSKPRPKTT